MNSLLNFSQLTKNTSVNIMTQEEIIATVNRYHEILDKVRDLKGDCVIDGSVYTYSEIDSLWYDKTEGVLFGYIDVWEVRIPIPMEDFF